MKEKNISILFLLILWWSLIYYISLASTSFYILIPFAILHIVFSVLFCTKEKNIYLLVVWILFLIQVVFSLYPFPLCNTYWKAAIQYYSCDCKWILRHSLFEEYCVWIRSNCIEREYENHFDLIKEEKVDCKTFD